MTTAPKIGVLRSLRAPLWAALWLLPRPLPAQAQGTSTPAFDVDRALRTAFERSPALAAARSRVAEAAGRLSGASRLRYNPSFDGAIAARNSSGQTSVDFDLGVEQQLEIAGQRGARVDAAERALAAARAQMLRAQRLLAARVHLRFVEALVARDISVVTRRDVELTERLHEIAQLRLQKGSATELDVNVAAAELGRSEARFQASVAAYTVSRAALAEAVGLSAPPEIEGTLHAKLDAPPSLDKLAVAARNDRADLSALVQSEAARRAEHEVARAEAWPDLTVRAFVGREDGTDTIIGGGVSIPLPLFNRNQGAVEQTRARMTRASAEREIRGLSATRQLASAHARYTAGERTAARLRQLVVGTLERNLELLERSFDAGKATWSEVVVIRRSIVEAQLQLARAQAQARLAWIELQLAAGRMPIPSTEGDQP